MLRVQPRATVAIDDEREGFVEPPVVTVAMEQAVAAVGPRLWGFTVLQHKDKHGALNVVQRLQVCTFREVRFTHVGPQLALACHVKYAVNT